MYLLGLTPRARAVASDYCMLAGVRERARERRRQREQEAACPPGEGAGGLLYLLYVVLVVGFVALIAGGSSGSEEVGLIALGVVAALPPVVMALSGLFTLLVRTVAFVWYRRLVKLRKQLLAVGDLLEVSDKVLEIWSDQCQVYGLRPNEDRTRLDRFPEVARRAARLQTAHESPVATADHKRLLRDQMELDMREVLVPLAEDLNYAAAQKQLVASAIQQADEVDQQRQAVLDRAAFSAEVETLLGSL